MDGVYPTSFPPLLAHRLGKSNRFFLIDQGQMQAKVKKLKSHQHPFDVDFSWVKKAFADDEFVVFLELVEHDEVLRRERGKAIDPSTCSADLNLKMRVRVFDLRGQEAVPILQEIVQDCHFIPQQFTTVNFLQTPWGDESFTLSPLGLCSRRVH